MARPVSAIIRRSLMPVYFTACAGAYGGLRRVRCQTALLLEIAESLLDFQKVIIAKFSPKVKHFLLTSGKKSETATHSYM